MMDISAVIKESTIDAKYYVDFFERLYKLHSEISNIPKKLHKAFKFEFNVYFHKPDLSEIRPQYYPIYPFLYLVYMVRMVIAKCRVNLLPKFDVNRFFEVFDLIKLDKGFTLDYEYCGDHPYVYTRKKLSIEKLFNFKKRNVIDELFSEEGDIENLSFEQSPEGFFQFAVFSIAVHQFYLYWHALENDRVFVYSRSQIDDILRTIIKEQYKYTIERKSTDYLSSSEIEKKADHELSVLFKNRKSEEVISTYLGPLIEDKIIDDKTGKLSIVESYWTSEEELIALFNASLHPQVVIMENGFGIVKMLSFTKWGGFDYHYSYIKWPNLVEKVRTETVLAYGCGIMF